MNIAVAKVEEYRIVSYNNHHRVQSEIEDLMKHDYQPWGELTVVAVPTSNIPIFTQVMVKYNELWPDA